MTRVTQLAAGAIAGGVSVTVFTVLHQVFINPIWFLYPVMLVAGVMCGVLLAWCYSVLVVKPSRPSWARFVTLFTVMFGLLAVASSLLYEPVYTMVEIVESSGGNPIPFRETAVLMLVFTVAWATLLAVGYRAGWRGFSAALIATAVLMLLLGFNVSTMGLVEIPKADWILVAEFFGYVVALGGSYGVVYWLVRERPGTA
ncbi:MAG: hypothetical protein R3258_09780 [Acidimicrobiia bacterium]|nr:hypothetical protein [Acidimicrobiia bacterium]